MTGRQYSDLVQNHVRSTHRRIRRNQQRGVIRKDGRVFIDARVALAPAEGTRR
jgi:hypothetical protein